MSNLTGKVALVTGGSRGIGAAIAKRLATDGATVALSYNTSADAATDVVAEIEAAGGTARAYRADAADAEANAALVRQVASDFDGLDILVNNAGVATLGPIGELTDEDYDHNIDVNLRGSFATIREAARLMRDGGRIVNIGSVVALQGTPESALYGASKAGATVLAKSAAKELGARRITVNVVHPGPIDTDLNPADPEKNPMAETYAASTALGRYGTVDEVAGAVAFLVSDDGGYVSGVDLVVDGGALA